MEEETKKISADLIKYEKSNQKITEQIATQQKVLDAVERNIGKSSSSYSNANKILNPELMEVWNKSFSCQDIKIARSNDDSMKKYYNMSDADGYLNIPTVKNGINQIRQISFKSLRTDVADAGGLLIPPEIAAEMLKNLTEITPMRQYAGTRTTFSNVLQIPARNVLLNSSEFLDVLNTGTIK